MATLIDSFNSGSKRNRISTQELIIQDNIIIWNNNMIQTSNITSVSSQNKQVSFPLVSIIIFIALALISGRTYSYSILSPIFYLVVIFQLVRYVIAMIQSEVCLHIFTASGVVFSIEIGSQDFADQVLIVLENVIRCGGKGTIHILGDVVNNIENNKISGDSNHIRIEIN